MGFAMPEISRRRTDQFCDFVAVLKLGAVDLQDTSGVAHKRFRSGFHQAGLAGPGGSQKQKISDRPANAGQACQESLIDTNDLVDRVFLSYHEPPQVALKLFRLTSS